jgi:ubiquinone/menaquinone biosynthesis C-methylase UbiE
MNKNHASLCPSPEWAEYIQSEILPTLASHAELGEQMLEIGPGPGAATSWLCDRVKHLTALEIDSAAAAQLTERFAGRNVQVAVGDATRLKYQDAAFDSVGCFTMLHHVPTPTLQNKIFAEALRVLRPGGVLIASDSVPSDDLHHFHEGDTYNPVEPGTIVSRLQTIGFARLTIIVRDVLMLVAHKQAEASEATR